MKAKYEKMIDAWVKKHYGNLERGVLSDEVKYKVLFKIYRKKYRTEKALRKSIEKMHKYTPTVTHPVAPHPDGFPATVDSSMCDKSLCLTCSHMYTEHDGARHCTLGREVTETRVGCANYAESKGEGNPLCDTCRYKNKDGKFCEQDLVQYKEADCYNYVYKPDGEEKPVTKSCHTCEYSKMSTLTDYMGSATSILYCEKKKYKCDLIDSQMCEYFKEKE